MGPKFIQTSSVRCSFLMRLLLNRLHRSAEYLSAQRPPPLKRQSLHLPASSSPSQVNDRCKPPLVLEQGHQCLEVVDRDTGYLELSTSVDFVACELDRLLPPGLPRSPSSESLWWLRGWTGAGVSQQVSWLRHVLGALTAPTGVITITVDIV